MLWFCIDFVGVLLFAYVCSYIIENYCFLEKFSWRACFSVFIVFTIISLYWWQTIIASTQLIQCRLLFTILGLMFFVGLFWHFAPIGTMLLSVGAISNKLAIVSNGGTMPVFVSPESSLYSLTKQSLRHHVASHQTHFAFLCDWIETNDSSTIMSIGDLFVILSGFIVVFELFRYIRYKSVKQNG